MKKIGTSVYTHISGVTQLKCDYVSMYAQARSMIDEKIIKDCVVIKIDYKNNKVSFIESEGFDVEREPKVGDAYCVNVETGEIKKIKSKGQIYHHKWMFVPYWYKGFDKRESEKWSKKWQSVIPNDRKIKSRIGYKKYWDEYLRKYGLEVE